MSWYRRYDYEPSKPLSAEGGIKSRAKSTDNWWSKQWYSFMDKFNLGARLTRGRAYARQGQVLDVKVEPGTVTASVQGSRRKPYSIILHFEEISADGWDRIIERLKEQALFAAKLLSGEVPQDLEQFFQDEGASLFPTLNEKSKMSCSCPDYSNPCKHIAAVFYVLGDAFDRDPFLILRLRGMPQELLLERLSEGLEITEDEDAEKTAEPSDPLPAGSLFFNGLALSEEIYGEFPQKAINAPLIRRLGNIPFWKGEKPILESLEEFYKKAAQNGQSILAGDISKL